MLAEYENLASREIAIRLLMKFRDEIDMGPPIAVFDDERITNSKFSYRTKLHREDSSENLFP